MRKSGYQSLNKSVRIRLKILENSIICILIMSAITSIAWSVTLHIISSDFHEGIFGAKLEFIKRNFQKLNIKSQTILNRDIEYVLRKIYLLEVEEVSNSKTDELHWLQNSTKHKPTERPEGIIPHLFQIASNDKVPELLKDHDTDNNRNFSKTKETTKIDRDSDRIFLSTMVLNTFSKHLYQNEIQKFIYNFPYLSEFCAIIWTAMCLVFQAGVNQYWGLPKPWRIVAPSILVFFIMTFTTAVYAFLANKYVKEFCNNLKMNLTDPDAISCGMAISVLRPKIKQHDLSHDAYLKLFQICYVAAFILWLLLLIIMALRFTFAIDFIVIDANRTTTTKNYIEDNLQEETSANSKQNDENCTEANKSDDDFYSALSRLTEFAEPLLEKKHSEIA